MASTFSSNLRIELIGNGDQSGTWGVTTNTNLGTLIEGAIAGYTSVSVASAAQALTANNGVVDQARVALLNLTTTTTAPFAVYAPPASKTYTVKNSAAYAATIYNSTALGNTTAAGTGVVIPAGATVTVWSDGTNFSAPSYLPSLSLGTALPVASGGTGAATFTSGGLLRGNGTGALTVASGADISAALGATAVQNANAVGGLTATNIQNSSAVVLGSVAGTDTITGALTPALTSYVAGQTFRFVSVGANTGPVTININGLGAKAITKNGATALAAGDIASGAAVQIQYDGTQFQLSSGAGGSSLRGGVVAVNGQTLTGNVTLATGESGMAVGPINGGGFSITGSGTARLVVL